MKTCIFCDRGAPEAKMTGEHVLRRKLAEQVLWPVPRTRTDAKALRLGQDGPLVAMSRDIPESILDQRLKDVCGDCNSGWMNRLENAVEPTLVPLLRGEPTPIGELEAQTLATWAAKTAMVRARVDTDPYVVPTAHRQHVRTCLTPPDNLSVWVSAYGPHGGARTRHRKVSMPVSIPVVEADENGDEWVTGVANRLALGHITYIAINHVILFVVEADEEQLWRVLDATLDPENTAVRLWPGPRSFTWPTTPALTVDQADDVCEGIARLPSGVPPTGS